MVYTWDGQVVENTFHYHYPTAVSEGMMLTLAGELSLWWQAHCQDGAPGTFVLTKILVTDLTSQSGGAIEYVTDLPLAGSGAGTYLPNNVALAIKWLTGQRGRSYRGRTFYMPIPSGFVSGNTVNSSGLSIIHDIFEALFALSGTEGLPEMVVASRYHNKAPRTTGVSTLITGFGINSTVDSQRRRLPGRGR
jgi:hypothetical protein